MKNTASQVSDIIWRPDRLVKREDTSPIEHHEDHYQENNRKYVMNRVGRDVNIQEEVLLRTRHRAPHQQW